MHKDIKLDIPAIVDISAKSRKEKWHLQMLCLFIYGWPLQSHIFTIGVLPNLEKLFLEIVGNALLGLTKFKIFLGNLPSDPQAGFAAKLRTYTTSCWQFAKCQYATPNNQPWIRHWLAWALNVEDAKSCITMQWRAQTIILLNGLHGCLHKAQLQRTSVLGITLRDKILYFWSSNTDSKPF